MDFTIIIGTIIAAMLSVIAALAVLIYRTLGEIIEQIDILIQAEYKASEPDKKSKDFKITISQN